MTKDDMRNEAFDREVSASIKNLFDLTTRIDERVEGLLSHQASTMNKFDTVADKLSGLSARTSVLESSSNHGNVAELQKQLHTLELRMNTMEINSGTAEGRWKTIVNFALQLVWVIIAAYLLYKLGIQAPAVP